MANETSVSRLGNIRNRIVRYGKEVRSELKKVIWLTRQQLINNTFTVLMSCLIIGGLIWVVDFGLQFLVGTLLTGK